MVESKNESTIVSNDERCICKILTRKFTLVDYKVTSITGNDIIVKMWAAQNQKGDGCMRKNCINRDRNNSAEENGSEKIDHQENKVKI